MNIRAFIIYCFSLLIKGIIVGIATLIGALIGYWLVLIIGIDLPQTSILFEGAFSILLFWSMIVITAMLIGELFKQLNQPFTERVISIFVYHFFFFYILRVFDGFLSSSTKLDFSYEIIYYIFPSVFFSVAVALIWKPKHEQNNFFKKLADYFKYKNLKKLLLSYVIATISFAIIYYLTNWLLFPFVEPFYNDLGNYRVNPPSFYLLFSTRIIVGAIFILVLMPVFVLLEMSKTSLLFWIGFPIFMQAAVSPASVEIWLPIGMRFPFLIQQTVITYLMAIILVQLFYFPRESEVIDDQFKWLY